MTYLETLLLNDKQGKVRSQVKGCVRVQLRGKVHNNILGHVLYRIYDTACINVGNQVHIQVEQDLL